MDALEQAARKVPRELVQNIFLTKESSRRTSLLRNCHPPSLPPRT